MADDVILPGTGVVVGADDRSGVLMQRIVGIGTTSIAVAQAACTSTGGSKVSTRATRHRLILLNLGPNAVYVGPSGVATSDGFKLAVGASVTLLTTAALHAVCATSETATLNSIEEYD